MHRLPERCRIVFSSTIDDSIDRTRVTTARGNCSYPVGHSVARYERLRWPRTYPSGLADVRPGKRARCL